MLHTIRQLVGDDARWRSILRGLNETFRHDIVTGAQVREYMSRESGLDLDPVFRQYLETTEVPTLEYEISGGELRHRWVDVVPGFTMPVEVRTAPERCVTIRPTAEWQSVSFAALDPEAFGVDRDYYVGVRTVGRDTRPPRADCSI
ncbi:MAG: hypothetical protein R3324_16065, partial [Halobacteriales archaeon]|nr:hypothetical protein [Halobacteriales archaeon]